MPEDGQLLHRTQLDLDEMVVRSAFDLDLHGVRGMVLSSDQSRNLLPTAADSLSFRLCGCLLPLHVVLHDLV